MTQDAEAALQRAFVGRACTVIRREFDWVFFFEQRRALVLTTPWRIVTDSKIVHAASDHEQKFGHAALIDGVDRANFLLSGKEIRTLSMHPHLSDLTFVFANGVTVEVFNGSSGYEAWQAEFPVEGGYQTIIGMGGGGVSTYSR